MSISSYIICQQRCNPNHQLSLKQSTKLQSKLPVIIETVNQITIQITSTEICTVQYLLLFHTYSGDIGQLLSNRVHTGLFFQDVISTLIIFTSIQICYARCKLFSVILRHRTVYNVHF